MADKRALLTEIFSGGGEMGRRMWAFDWSQTPAGPVSEWPQALRTAVRIMLTSRQPMFVWWGDELTNLYNDAYRSILGGKHPAALGQPAATVWREIWDQVGPRARAAMRDNKGTYDEALLLIMERHGYREETYYTFSYSPVPDDTGGAGGIFCANTDDTQRIIGERQLALLRRLAAEAVDARTIDEACLDAAHSLETDPWDLPFALIYVADQEYQQLHLACRASIPEDHPIAVPASPLTDDATLPFAAVVASHEPRLVTEIPPAFGALPTGAWDQPPRQIVLHPIAASGQTAPAGVLVVGLNPYRLYDDDYQRFLTLVSGQIAAAIGNAQAYEAERQRAEALAELDRAKTQFFSNVSHEFRTPLTLLLGPLDDALAASTDETTPARREQLQLAHRNALRLLRLVNTLLDFSRIEAGRVQASYQRTDLPTLTADLASTFRSVAERAGLRWTVDCPPLPPKVETYVDRDMWEKIVLNLLSNAFKFTLAGEVVLSLRPAPDGSAVQLTVRDTGSGIPREELPRLFERFHRVQGTEARTHEGTGIGLALIHELVKLHSGTITVESEIGQGTTFVVTIPTGSAHLPSERIDAGSDLVSTAVGAAPYVEEALRWLPGPTTDAAPIRQDLTALIERQHEQVPVPTGGRVLFVDDNADMRQYVTRLLDPFYEVEAVADGEAALVAIHARPPDLVLSDIMMPRLDGLGLLRVLRAEPATRDLPVILLSAPAGADASTEGLVAGADDYLIKPFTARELLARVGTHVALSHMRADASRREQAAHAEADAERVRLHEVFAQAPTAIVLLSGPEHTFTLANAEFRRMVGRDPVGQTIRDAFPEIVGQGVIEILDNIRATGEPFTATEFPIRLAREHQGVPVEGFYNVSCQPIKDKTGQVTTIFAHGVDVTEQVRARQRLETEVTERRQAEALLAGERAVLELIGRGAELSDVLTALIRMIEAQTVGMRCSILVRDPDEARFALGVAPSLPEGYLAAVRHAPTGSPYLSPCCMCADCGVEVITADIESDERWAAEWRDLALAHGLRTCYSSPILAADGRVLGSFGMYFQEPRDPIPTNTQLTHSATHLAGIAVERAGVEEERARLLAREQAARLEAEAAVRARDEFLSIAAHELRTPVAAIKGMAQLTLRAARRGTMDMSRAEKALQTIEQSVDRLTTLINDLLDVSRLQRGQLTLRQERIDLVAFIRDIAAHQAELLDHAYDVQIATPAEEIAVMADPGRLEQVFDNLFSNAVKYSPSGGVIALEIEHEPERAVVAVRDQGIGLPAGEAEQIFEPFGRASNATARNLPGMGLGLHVSRRIVELHGGRLWAESDGEDRGTTFRLWLPLPLSEVSEGEEQHGDSSARAGR